MYVFSYSPFLFVGVGGELWDGEGAGFSALVRILFKNFPGGSLFPVLKELSY